MKIITNILGTIGILFIGAVGCTALFANSYNNVTKESEGTAEVTDASWVPSGFTAWNNDVAMKWSDNGSYSCDARRCIQMEVVAKNGCGSLYAESALVDSAGNNVGYTNATSSGVKPLQKALLMLDTYNENTAQFQLSKISCY
jgi:hypothetical protein